MDADALSDDALLEDVQRETFGYFLHEVNDRNGLVADCTRPGWPCSIAATGLALASYPVGVEHGWMTRDAAVARTLATLEFLANSVQDTRADATGYKGFYYHFLDMDSGRRTWDSELSTVDSTFLIAGALLAAEYFDRCTDEERRIRALADALYRRMDWRWAQNGGAAVSHGWKPEPGFLPYRWQGYSEALLLYALGLGSPTYPLSADAYPAWLSTYDWRELYGQAHVYAGPLFIHQLSHAWVDFRGIRDDYMRDKGIDYFENSRRATLVQARYAIDNPEPVRLLQRQLLGDHGGRRTGACGIRHRGCPAPLPRIRGAPLGPDDGTYSPWVVVASLRAVRTRRTDGAANGIAASTRPDRAAGGEPQDRVGLAPHAPLRLSPRRIAPRGLCRRLARLTPFIAMADRAAGDGIG
jgi:hypothetical protein